MAKLINFHFLAVPLFLLGCSASMAPALGILPNPPDSWLESRPLIAGWGSVFSRRVRRLTIRGGICPITPGLVGTIKVWNDRPLLVWKGIVQQINIRDHASGESLWSHSLNVPVERFAYNGKTLEAGKLYQWQVLGAQASNSDRAQWFTFEIMSAEERALIATDIQELEQQIQDKSAEAIALRKAQYFADQELWSDALQVVYAIDDPSAEILEIQRSLRNRFCPLQSPEATM
jgi:hypothetical protein